MKRNIMLAIAAAIALAGYSQMPKWVVSPSNDTIFVKVDNCIIQSMTDGESTLWTMGGKKLFQTEHTILPFRD